MPYTEPECTSDVGDKDNQGSTTLTKEGRMDKTKFCPALSENAAYFLFLLPLISGPKPGGSGGKRSRREDVSPSSSSSSSSSNRSINRSVNRSSSSSSSSSSEGDDDTQQSESVLKNHAVLAHNPGLSILFQTTVQSEQNEIFPEHGSSPDLFEEATSKDGPSKQICTLSPQPGNSNDNVQESSAFAEFLKQVRILSL